MTDFVLLVRLASCNFLSMNTELTKTPHGWIYRGVAITKEKSGGFSYGWNTKVRHGRSYPDTLKNTMKNIDQQLLNNSVENCRIAMKG